MTAHDDRMCSAGAGVDRIVRMVNHSSEESQKKKIPSLDGLRAVSILLVLLSHSFKDVHPGQGLHHGLLAIVGACGANGVSVFFAISGFLITSLLIKERARFGKISLSGFYIRRAFRILPAFAAFILVMWILAHRGVISIDPHQFLYAITFTMDYMGHVGAPNDWFLGHVWSLSVGGAVLPVVAVAGGAMPEDDLDTDCGRRHHFGAVPPGSNAVSVEEQGIASPLHGTYAGGYPDVRLAWWLCSSTRRVFSSSLRK